MAYVPGMPSNIPKEAQQKAQEAYKKQQEQKKSNSSSSTSSSVPGLPSNVPTEVQQQAQETYNNQQAIKISTSSSVPGLPSNLPTEVKKNAQKIYNYTQYVNSLPTQPTLFSPDASKLLQSTNTYMLADGVLNGESPATTMRTMLNSAVNADRAYEVIPTADREKIKKKFAYMSSEDYKKADAFTKEVYNLILSHESEYKQRTLNEMIESRFWAAGETQLVTATTAQDYYNMQKNGYELVYVEDGCGKLANKGGVFSIGRDKLSGLPHDVHVVLVDHAGNWKYLADTGSKAVRVEEIQAEQAALTARMESKLSDAYSEMNFAQQKCEELYKRIELYDKVANITRAQGDIDALQKAIEEYATWERKAKAHGAQIKYISDSWADKYLMYDKQIDSITKWTVEDEAHYQDVKAAIERSDKAGLNKNIRNNVHDSSVADILASDTKLLTEYLELTKRRDAAMGETLFLNLDTLNTMHSTEESMKKAIDEYNKWDSVTIHVENGEDLGAQIKRLMMLELNYDEGFFNVDWNMLIKNPTQYLATTNIARAVSSKEYREEFVNITKDAASAVTKQVTPYITAYKEAKKATKAYNETIKLINSGKLNEQELADARNLLQGYLSAQQRAVSQANSIVMNNVIANLSVMDLYSLQSTFVAWRMAKHPDRYSNDPKFKKLQDAYKDIYGEDYNGAMDAAKMAHAMLDIKTGNAGDYIYVDGSDLRHSSGKKYGTAASLGVGLLTDLSAVAGLGKTAVEVSVKKATTKALVKEASDAYIQSLVRAEVTQEVAEEFIKSKTMQRAITKDVKKALNVALKDSTEEFGKVLRTQFSDRAKMLDKVFVDDLVKGLDEARYTRFLKSAIETFNTTANFAEKSLLLNKASVIAKTLGGFDEAMDTAQKTLFKMTCPVAGAVTAVAKGSKYIKALKNLKNASPENLAKLAVTQRQVAAKIAKLDIDACFNAGKFNKLHNDIIKEFHWGLLDNAKHKLLTHDKLDNIVKCFSDYKDTVMRGVANSYVDSVVNKFRKIIDEEGTVALETYAKSYNFDSFDEMLKTVKNNISIMYEHSPEARYIMDAFESYYSQFNVRDILTRLHTYTSKAKEHYENVYGLLRTFGISESTLKASDKPFIQGIAKSSKDAVHDFLATADPDFMYFREESLQELGSNLMSVLDKIACGHITNELLTEVRFEISHYRDFLKNVYIPGVKGQEDTMLSHVLGDTYYCDAVKNIAGNHAGNLETIQSIHDGLINYFKTNNIDVSKDTIDKILVSACDTKEFEKLSLTEQESLIYRITLNKGSNMINQINDKALEKVSDDLTNCNSKFNKDLRLLQIYFGNYGHRIDQAIETASAMKSVKTISDELIRSGVDSTMYLDVMDVLSGKSSTINRILQTCSPNEAAVKIKNYILSEICTQSNLHGGTYNTFRNLGADTVDVVNNITNIEKHLSEHIPEDDQFLDITVSMVKSTDTAAPKDIAFHTRGSADEAIVFRKNTAFTVYDDEFASRIYGKTAAQLNAAYEALGNTHTLSSEEWQKQLKEYIEKQKQIALEQNKTIRFIGFNSSDAISGGNKYLSDVLRSCGVNANVANTLDLADIMRSKAGDYVFDPSHIEALYRGIRDAIDSAKARSISLDITPTIAYDSSYDCSKILYNTFKDYKLKDETLMMQFESIKSYMNDVNKRIDVTGYNEAGLAMGAYLNATEFARVLEDAGQSSLHSNNTLMKIITEATVRGESQLGLHKIIATAMDKEWIDYSKVAAEKLEAFKVREKIHESIVQINSIHKGLHRLDLITDADITGLKYIYKEMVEIIPEQSHAFLMARLFKVDELSAQQLYAVNKWLLDQTKDLYQHPKFKQIYNKMYEKILINAQRQTSYLSDTGYNFIRNNIIDYTDDILDMFSVKYLDDSEEGYKFAKALNDISGFNDTVNNLNNYNAAIEGLFNRFNVHGVQDKALLMQNAEVHRPIINFQNEIKRVYNTAYKKAVADLRKETSNIKIITDSPKPRLKHYYSEEMINKVATERGVNAAKQYIVKQGEKARTLAVKAVVDLDADSLKAHLIRNCGGGLIIDPSAKCVEGLDLLYLFEQWKTYGIKIDIINFSNDIIRDKKLFRISLPELDNANMDEIFAKYNHANITFKNKTLNRFNNNMRHCSFNASDMTLMNANHMDKFKELFFSDGGTVLDFHKNFNSWADELYSCNMWTDMDLKQLVNPYYTDNMINNLAQSTHQLRNNMMAMHDLGSIINNKYMNTSYILNASGVYKSSEHIGSNRNNIVNQIISQKQKVCRLVLDEHNKIKVVDYTPILKKANTSDTYFKKILDSTVLLDEGIYSEISDWSKSTSIALKMQASNVPEWLSSAYNIYKKTLRSGTITMFLYGNIGTAVRNYVDSSSKGLFETLQYDQDAVSYIKKYMRAVSDVHEYSNIYRQIENELGTVNRETVTKFFEGNVEGLNKFNILYGYEHTCGGDSLVQDLSIKRARKEAAKHFTEGTNISDDFAEQIRKNIDTVYNSPKYYGLTNAQLKEHMVEIHDKCMKRIKAQLNPTRETLDIIDNKFWDYHPTVVTWGDQMSRFPVLRFNRGRFNNAEVRARLAVYETFLEGGSSEYEAMQHVTATQFHYAGIGKIEDVMPFTQYKLYNALYWFDNANARAITTAWRTAQYNGDGAMTNKEITDLCTKYRQKDYYLYEKGVDKDYDRYYEGNLSLAEHVLLDGVDSYLGVPREFKVGNLDLNGTHYLKLGNSFVEEIDMVTTFAVGAVMFTSTIGDHIQMGKDLPEKIRYAYESFKYTPLYDSMYSPWKSYIDLIVYNYDHKFSSIKDAYKDFMANKSTHSEAIMCLSCAGAVLANLVGRMKSFDLNLGQLAALTIDPYAKQNMGTYIRDMLCDITGMLVPSLVGTKIESDNYYTDYTDYITNNYLRSDPTTYFDMYGRLQKMGFSEDETKSIMASMKAEWADGTFLRKQDYMQIAKDLLAKGYTITEVTNMFEQHKLPSIENKRFLGMWSALPGYIKYDADMRKQVIDYFKAMGMTTDEAWAYLLTHPSIIRNGKLIELSPSEVMLLNKRQSATYWALHDNNLTDEEWDAYWASMPYRYPKGKWSETYHYLIDAGYDKEAARAMLLHGYMLDANGRLIDVQGQVRAKVFYDYSRPLGYDSFNTYYQTLPNYIKYEKGAFSRTYQALKSLGFDYETSLKLIQQGAYLIDATAVPALMQTLGAKRERANEFIPVTDITSLLLKYGGRIIKGADGKDYMLIDCSGLQRPRKTYNYSGGGYSRRQWYNYGGRSSYNRYPWVNYPKYKKKPKYSQYYTRKPFVQQGNVSSFSGFTRYRGKTPDKLTKPYTTKGYVSTYSLQNFLNGASYGMRKAYKIDMRQFKTGALSIKSSYPASYRNIAVAYRRNLYKDLYAKYGASRMRMRSNQPGYSNASITRLRRNEIYNRERYAERRDRKAQEKVKLRAAR